MNKVILLGRITKDIELKKTQSDKSVVAFTIAVKRDYKNAQGQYDSDFLNCVAYDKTAETISKYFTKGQRIGVVGKLNTRSYENNNGQKVYVTEIIVNEIEFIETKAEQEAPKQEEHFETLSASDELPF